VRQIVLDEHRMNCEELAAVDAELALGVADARARATAFRHLEECPSCRRRVQRLSEVPEGLTELVPPVEPSLGFESRVMSQLRREPSRAAGVTGIAGASGRRVKVAAAIVVLVLGAGTAGWLVGTSGGTARVPTVVPATTNGPPVTADLVGQHGTIGQVVLTAGQDPWLSMAVRDEVDEEWVRCQAVEGSGRVLTLGSFPVVGGYGYWASALPGGTTVRAVRLVGRSGAVLATADVGSWIS
jgi:hypothetical protein